MSFSQLKKTRKKSMDSLTKEIEKLNSNTRTERGSNGDDRIWKLTVDKAENGTAVLRFLPAPDGEDIPWVRLFTHGFQGPGGWYIEKSLTTLGKKDPVSEYNTRLWNSGVDADKETARKQKRKLQYFSNIYVVSDPANPENEGKTFLYQYGKKIHDKIKDTMHPEFDDETPVNPFDLWEGADFKLRARQVAGFRNYDKSEFASPSALFDDDAELERVWKQGYSLEALVAPDQFKEYVELKARFERVIGNSASSSEVEGSYYGGEYVQSAPLRAVEAAPALETSDNNDEDDNLSYFSKLAEDV
jgi:hypothetical protein